MPSIFTRIIDGEIPGRFLWKDDRCVSFLDVRPLARGHALVIPRSEIDEWTDLPPETATHLMTVAHAIGRAQKTALSPARIGLMIAGFEVPHVHVHVVPMNRWPRSTSRRPTRHLTETTSTTSANSFERR